MNQGSFQVLWFDPQTGKYLDQKVEVKVESGGILKLEVPSFTKDLACLIRKVE